MHDSDFEVLSQQGSEAEQVHHYHACLKRQTRTVTHCHVQFVNQLHYILLRIRVD